jgi:hypothetical protein
VAPLISFFFEGAIATGNGDNDDGNKGNDNDDNNDDDDDNNNNDDDAVFTHFDPADLPFMSSFVGITIEGGDLRFVGLPLVVFCSLLF